MLLISWNKQIQGRLKICIISIGIIFYSIISIIFYSTISTAKSYRQAYWQSLQCLCCPTCFINVLLTNQGKAHVPFLSLEINWKPAWSLIMDNSCLQDIIFWHLVRKKRKNKVCWRSREAVQATQNYSPLTNLLSAWHRQWRLRSSSVPIHKLMNMKYLPKYQGTRRAVWWPNPCSTGAGTPWSCSGDQGKPVISQQWEGEGLTVQLHLPLFSYAENSCWCGTPLVI